MKHWKVSTQENKTQQSDLPLIQAIEAIATQNDLRSFRSETGTSAILCSRAQLNTRRDITVDLDERVSDKQIIGVVLSDSANFETELQELAEHCDHVAVPANTAYPASAFEVRGKIYLTGDKTPESTWNVLSAAATTTNMLLRDAPLNISEGDGNLKARENWFKSRNERDS